MLPQPKCPSYHLWLIFLIRVWVHQRIQLQLLLWHLSIYVKVWHHDPHLNGSVWLEWINYCGIPILAVSCALYLIYEVVILAALNFLLSLCLCIHASLNFTIDFVISIYNDNLLKFSFFICVWKDCRGKFSGSLDGLFQIYHVAVSGVGGYKVSSEDSLHLVEALRFFNSHHFP